MQIGSRIAAWFGEDKEEAMYKELWEMYVGNEQGAIFKIPADFKYDFSMTSNAGMANGQVFRNNRFKEIHLPKAILSNVYGFSSTTLEKVVCLRAGNAGALFTGCTKLKDVYTLGQSISEIFRNTSLLNNDHKNITFHAIDGDVYYDTEEGKWKSRNSASNGGGGINA